MSPRDSEREFEGLFTTKATGGGLGLAFVRVALAHGGEVGLSTVRGKGTAVELRFALVAAGWELARGKTAVVLAGPEQGKLELDRVERFCADLRVVVPCSHDPPGPIL